MGYDMYWVQQPPEDKAAYGAAFAIFNQRVRERDVFERDTPENEQAQKVVLEALSDMEHAERYYFRLNVWGMQTAREKMQEIGMLCDPPGPSSTDWDGVPEYDENVDDGGPAYRQAHDAIVSAHRGECPGIPYHKLCSNDGWIVTPAEIRPALERAALNVPSDPPEWWSDWLDWLQEAEQHGGFEVN